MRLGRYSYLLASGVFGLAILLLFFNVIIDPLDVSPVHIVIPRINAAKPYAADRDRLTKRFLIRRLQPATLFMGSSRVKQAMDPRLADSTDYAPAFNAGMDNSAAVSEFSSYLHYFLEKDKNLRHVFIEVFPVGWLQDHPMNRDDIASHDLADLTGALFSADSTVLSFKTIFANLRHAGLPDNGYDPVEIPSKKHFLVKNVFNFIEYELRGLRDAKMPEETSKALERMVADCQAHRVDCRFFISPLHTDALLGLEHIGLWPQMELLKRMLAGIAPTYDFTQYNYLIDERDGPVVYWPEAFHFSPALGRLVVETLLGERPSYVPANFGAILTKANVEANLTRWRSDYSQWILSHPESVKRMTEADVNFAKGRTFQEATAREAAAAGL